MDSAGKPLALLVNPSAGGGRALKRLPAVERELHARRFEFRVERTRSVEHGVQEALRAAGSGEIPVVVSGDGLIGAVGGALANSEVPLGIVPGGRGNDLARVLGIPTEPAAAVAVLAAGAVRRIDVGEANGRRFLCIASVGFDAVANRLANETRFVRGKLVYALAAVRTLASWKPVELALLADGEQLRFSGYSVSIANSNAFGGGMFVAPDASLDDAQLDVVMISEASKLRFLSNLPKVFRGTHVESEEISVVRAHEVEVTANRPLEVYADGEHLTDLPATIRVLPQALSVIAPPAS